MQRAPRTTLSADLAATLLERIRSRDFQPGSKLPTEQIIMQTYGVSRTVVREALSHLQAGGSVETRHGVGTFVTAAAPRPALRVRPRHQATLQEVIAVLEFRIGIETEATALAAQRREAHHLTAMKEALDQFNRALDRRQDAVQADYRFHQEIAAASNNRHFTEVMNTLGPGVIPRQRLQPAGPMSAEREAYLRRVNLEHESIYNAIASQDVEAARAAMRTHLVNSRDRLRHGEVPPAPGLAKVV